jgi:hypothetical protein
MESWISPGTTNCCRHFGGVKQMQSTRDLLVTIYERFNARDIEAVLAALHPDVDWPNGMEGGRIYGRGNVREYWLRQWGVVDSHVEPLRFEEDEPGRTVIDVHQVVRDLAGNLLADQMVQHVYSVRDGLIERMEIVNPVAEPESGERSTVATGKSAT